MGHPDFKARDVETDPRMTSGWHSDCEVPLAHDV